MFFSLVFFFCVFSVRADTKTYTVFDENPLAKKVWGTSSEALTKNEDPEIAKLILPQNPEQKIKTLYESSNERPTWLENAVNIPDSEEDKAKIAIVIDDLGLKRSITRNILNLPAPITAAFLPYADDLEEQTRLAKEKGHELLVHIPMEPISPHFNPGPNALSSDMSAEEIIDKLEIMLSSFEGYVGINNHMGSKFTSNAVVSSIIINELEKRGLLFLDSLTSANSTAWKKARDRHVPYAVRNIFLDNSKNGQDIMQQLALLEKHALKHHTAVAIGHPHEATVNALKEWIPQAQKKGFVFVPVSHIALIRQDVF